jgi:hypothetical protein
MNPRFRNGLFAAGSAVLAVYLGWQIADGAYALPALVAAAIVAAVLVRLARLPIDAIFVGLLLIGLIVGNRGFAQLMPAPGIPLLPAELVLGAALGWRIIVCAFERRLPFQSDALNWAVLAWLVVGTARVVFDVPRHGLLAVRDYATVYYALFFFLAQHMARDRAVARYFIGCLLVAGVLLGPAFALSKIFESFFLTKLTVNGVPLIFFKGDLAPTYLAACSILIFHWAQGGHRFWAWPLSAAMFAYVAPGHSRSSLVGGVVACTLLMAAGRWRYSVLQGAVSALALLVIVALATGFGNVWAERKLEGLTDRVVSVFDVTGTRRYTSEDSFYKGDNNRFRAVWWKNVALETWETNPVFGLGFGSDLAAGFLQEYYPDGGEDFAARSPHNIFMTVLGRMGAVGLAVWCGFCVILLRCTWRALRHLSDSTDWGLWCAAWVILVSATFGVVLEGPMGAVIFWTLLGLANTRATAARAEPDEATPAAPAAAPALP